MKRNWAEWVVLLVSVGLLAGIVGFLVIDGIRDEGAPPRPIVVLHRERAYDAETGWLLPATVRNAGDVAAEAVVLRASATVGGTAEESEITIDYLPAGTSVEVTFGWSGEPDGEVTVQAVGFRLP